MTDRPKPDEEPEESPGDFLKRIGDMLRSGGFVGSSSITMGHYIKDEQGRVIPVDLMTWAAWFEDINKRIVKRTELAEFGCVSTVFLGLDHSFAFGNINPLTYKPVLWETMVFGGPLDEFQERYSSEEEAVKAHDLIVERVKFEGHQEVMTALEEAGLLGAKSDREPEEGQE